MIGSRVNRRRTDLISKTSKAKRPVRKPAAKASKSARTQEEESLLKRVIQSLDADKAEDIVTIDLEGRSSIADALVIASGRSTRHVASIAEHLARKLKEAGYGSRPLNGASQGDWALVDAGDVIVHIFRPEVRAYYDLEGMWSVKEPSRRAAI
jgi:ribosome-associated protein